MNLTEAKELASEKMWEQGLRGWSFQFSRAKRGLGLCNSYKKIIKLSMLYTQLNDREEVLDTILHEIAHALVGAEKGHGYEWKSACRKIGAKAERLATSDTINMPQAKYVLTCPNCGKERSIYRKPKYVKIENGIEIASHKACGKCCREYNNGKFDAKYNLIIKPRDLSNKV